MIQQAEWIAGRSWTRTRTTARVLPTLAGIGSFVVVARHSVAGPMFNPAPPGAPTAHVDGKRRAAHETVAPAGRPTTIWRLPVTNLRWLFATGCERRLKLARSPACYDLLQRRHGYRRAALKSQGLITKSPPNRVAARHPGLTHRPVGEDDWARRRSKTR
jgi:hypothetical protein